MLSLKGLTGRITSQFFVIVSLSIIITSIIGYVKLYEVTAKNADIRIDRAARAAASIFTLELPSEYAAINGESGQPIAVRLKNNPKRHHWSLDKSMTTFSIKLVSPTKVPQTYLSLIRKQKRLIDFRQRLENLTGQCHLQCLSKRAILLMMISSTTDLT
jgi:hypothetical protein